MLILVFIIHLAGPQSEIISDELHNSGGILVLFFINVLDIGNGVIEGSLS